MNFPKLYGKTKAGKIKEWEVKVVQFPNDTALIQMEHGLQDGKKTTSEKHITEGKNIGKSNETTPYEQACSEAQSRWNKQVDKGYATSEDDIEMGKEREYFLPMLAVRQDKRGHKLSWPAYAQPKLDGFRCLARKKDGEVELWSRRGKTFDIPKEIISELKQILKEGECLDGELYKHEWRAPNGDPDFQRISAAAKKYRDDTALLEYHVYDIPDAKRSFEDRFVDCDIVDRIADAKSERILLVETVQVANEQEALDLYEDWITGERPYEGAMIRNAKGLYMFDHRSNDLQKIKPLDDAEFEIIGGQEATGNDAGTVVFKCVAENGEEFDVRPTGTREERAEYLENLDSYIGQWLTVEFNGRSNSGKPRFPRGVKIRPEWDVDLRGKKPSGKAKPKTSAGMTGSLNPFAKAQDSKPSKPEEKMKGSFNPFNR